MLAVFLHHMHQTMWFMRFFFGLMGLSLMLAGCQDSDASAVPPPNVPKPPERTYNFVISHLTDTKLELRPGMQVRIRAEGQINFGLFAGTASPDGTDASLIQRYNFIQEAFHGALIYRINGGAWRKAGASTEFVVRDAGTLFLEVNDKDQANNSGSFYVRVILSE